MFCIYVFVFWGSSFLCFFVNFVKCWKKFVVDSVVFDLLSRLFDLHQFLMPFFVVVDFSFPFSAFVMI